MFISVLELFKIGIGPSSSHTLGPMVAAKEFTNLVVSFLSKSKSINDVFIKCTLKGSLSFTGKGHATDRAIVFGLHGYIAEDLVNQDIQPLFNQLCQSQTLPFKKNCKICFSINDNLIFDKDKPLPQHPNGMIFELMTQSGEILFSETYFSIGGGFIKPIAEIDELIAPLKMKINPSCPYPFDSAKLMIEMSRDSHLSVSEMKQANERMRLSNKELDAGLDKIWQSMKQCVEKGLRSEGILPGGLEISRRAKRLHDQLQANPENTTVNDWLCAYAMAVNEENAAGHMVVTAPTNGAAGVIPSVLYYLVVHKSATKKQIRSFLLTAAAIGGIIKHRSSISGAEVGCQGEVGSAASMAAAGLCIVQNGTTEQIENAAEIALEHHLGMTCDPVKGLVQVPCIERNGFGAIKAYTAASLALRESGEHFMPLDNCIAAMKQTGLEMSDKYKETSLGGLAVSITEC